MMCTVKAFRNSSFHSPCRRHFSSQPLGQLQGPAFVDWDSVSFPLFSLCRGHFEGSGVFSSFLLGGPTLQSPATCSSAAVIVGLQSPCSLSGQTSSIHTCTKLYKKQNFHLHRGVWRVNSSHSVGERKTNVSHFDLEMWFIQACLEALCFSHVTRVGEHTFAWSY